MQRQVQVWSGEVRGGLLVVRGESELGKMEVRVGEDWWPATEAQVRAVKVEKLTARANGLEELLLCAARGGHVAAKEVVEILESYGVIGEQPE